MLVPLAAWVGAWSLLAFVAAAWDKAKARRGGSRVRERTLLGLAAVGGSPGLVLALLVVRHKTRKPRFLAQLAVIAAAQLAVLALFVRS